MGQGVSRLRGKEKQEMAVWFRKILAVFALIAVFFMAGLAFLAGLVLLLLRLIMQIARAKPPPASQTIIDMPNNGKTKNGETKNGKAKNGEAKNGKTEADLHDADRRTPPS